MNHGDVVIHDEDGYIEECRLFYVKSGKKDTLWYMLEDGTMYCAFINGEPQIGFWKPKRKGDMY